MATGWQVSLPKKNRPPRGGNALTLGKQPNVPPLSAHFTKVAGTYLRVPHPGMRSMSNPGQEQSFCL
jgi:hypothetical protein